MKWFYDLKIATKLITAFLAVIVLVVALGTFAIIQLAKVNAASTDIATNWLPSIRVLAELELAVARLRNLEQQRVLAADPAEFAEIDKTAEQQIANLQNNRKAYEPLLSAPEEYAMFPQLSKLVDAYVADHAKILAQFAQNKNDDARALLKGDALKDYQQLVAVTEKLIEVNDRGASDSNKVADDAYASSRIWIIGMLAVCIVLGLMLAVWMARMISLPLVAALKAARKVADGDLSGSIRADRADETGQLLSALKDMNDNLLRIVGNVRQGTDTIGTASREIASGNMDLSSRTEEQAGSLEETASAMEELTSTVKQNADNARQANQLAVSASSVAIQGGEVVRQVVDTMGAINDSSRKIVDIISVIDGIAFQTNILALNAAVEAARAGEQGRGFAVVASEVRSLAQRSSAAAKEIKQLIDDSVTKVDAGSKLVMQAGSTMEEVVGSVQRVTDIVSEISAATQEQSVGLDEINRAITQMDQVTQQNAALVEEAAAAAQSLQEQASHLSVTVSIFKLDSHGSSSPHAPMHTAHAASGTAHAATLKPASALTAKKPAPALKSVSKAMPKALARPAAADVPAKPREALSKAQEDGGAWEEF